MFKVLRAEAQELYDKGLVALVASCPDSLMAMNRREQAVGSLQELKRFLDQPATMREDLNQHIENKQNA